MLELPLRKFNPEGLLLFSDALLHGRLALLKIFVPTVLELTQTASPLIKVVEDFVEVSSYGTSIVSLFRTELNISIFSDALVKRS